MTIGLLDLPWLDIICLKIFPYLSVKDWLSFRRVSKRALQVTHEYFRMMRSLDLSKEVTPSEIFQTIANESRHIRRLCLQGTKVTNAEIQRLFQNNPNLVEVNLSCCLQLTNGCLQPMAVNCKKLEKIVLVNCRWLSVGALETMSYHNTLSLTSADFTGCTSVNENSLILFIARHPRLKELSLANMSFVRDRTLSYISQSCPQLEFLNLEGCSGITDDGLKYVIEYCSSLKHLDVRRCQKISEKSLKRLRQRGSVRILGPFHSVQRNHYPPWRLLPT